MSGIDHLLAALPMHACSSWNSLAQISFFKSRTLVDTQAPYDAICNSSYRHVVLESDTLKARKSAAQFDSGAGIPEKPRSRHSLLKDTIQSCF